jgi:hypothetical protein
VYRTMNLLTIKLGRGGGSCAAECEHVLTEAYVTASSHAHLSASCDTPLYHAVVPSRAEVCVTEALITALGQSVTGQDANSGA